MTEQILLTGIILLFFIVGLLQGYLTADGYLRGWLRMCISFFTGSLAYMVANLFLTAMK